MIYRYEFWIKDPDTLCCRIAYPPEHYSCCFSIIPYKRHNTNKTKYKDFQSDYFLFMIYRYEFWIKDPDTLCCRIAYPPEHYSCCFSIIPYKRHNTNKTKYKDFQSACFLFMIYRYEFRIADPYTLCCRIAYPPEQ